MTESSSYRDLDRPPLRESALGRAVTRPPSLWRELRVLEEVGSTNAVVAAEAKAGAAEGLVVAAELQTAGRGRLDRVWTTPPRSAVLVSMLLRPAPVPPIRWGWLPLLAGVALAQSLDQLAGLPSTAQVALKWPNDLLIDGRKAAGVLAEVVAGVNGGAVVVGVGLNVTTRAEELPALDATSLSEAGAGDTDRDTLLRGLLRAMASWYDAWRRVGGDPRLCGLDTAYRESCDTLGAPVRVTMPSGELLEGTTCDIDPDGRLMVETGSTTRFVSAGDVQHVHTTAQ